MNLYDYIYVDIEKAVSLYSQLTGGVVEVREAVSERSRNQDNKRKYDFKVFKHDAGGTEGSKEGLKETIKPYHSFLAELEDELEKNYHMAVVDEEMDFRNSDTRQLLSEVLCLKVTGRGVIEDYERIKLISKAYPDLVSLINKSIQSSVKDTPEYITALERIEELEEQTQSIKDKNQKHRANLEIREQKKKLNQISESVKSVDSVEQWILDGMKTWIDTFLPNITNLRIYPPVDDPTIHVFGHLKPECFTDSDSNSFHFTYGSIPSEDISMVGIVTSVPPEDEDDFNPLVEFGDEELSANESIERAFRGIFRGFDGFENMVRTARYPRVLVYPILVYRKSKPNKTLQATAASRHA